MDPETVLRSSNPRIKWDEPQVVSLLGDDLKHYACRYCIAMYGISGAKVKELPTTIAEFDDHLRKEHRR